MTHPAMPHDEASPAPERMDGPTPASPPDVAFVAERLRPWLAAFLEEEATRWKALGAPWHDPIDWTIGYLDRGKALRPRFCYWGHAAVGGEPDRGDQGADLMTACAALELLHTFALIHDDLMDGSSRRRGRPALHRALARDHELHGLAGPATRYGTAAALLTGDLAFALACRLAATLPMRTRPVWDRLVTELTAGQYLDLAAEVRADRSSALADLIARLKSGRYTITGPLRLGAAVAGQDLPAELITYGESIGAAFQLRDDILGVFGDPAATGKPVGEDLRTGKATLLIAYARQMGGGRQRTLLDRAGGTGLGAGEIAEITEVIEATGARDRVERRIQDAVATGRAVLAACALPAPVAQALSALAEAAANRDR